MFLQGVSCTPDLLTRALVDHVLERNLKNLKLFQFFPLGETPYLRDELKGRIRMTTAFASKIYALDFIVRQILQGRCQRWYLRFHSYNYRGFTHTLPKKARRV